MYGERYFPQPPPELCPGCDAELEPDEPQTCYFTGGGHCGDCRDPRTNKPPYEGGCFKPRLCEECQAFDAEQESNEQHSLG